jgi:hypothetical protein
MSENEEYIPNDMSQNADELISIANETIETKTITRRTLSTQTDKLDISSEDTTSSYSYDYQKVIKSNEILFISIITAVLLTYRFTTIVSFLLFFFN